jgi:hypothetical protein
MDSDPFNIKYLLPLSGTNSAEVESKFVTYSYYAFLFRTNGDEMQRDWTNWRRTKKIEKLNK